MPNNSSDTESLRRMIDNIDAGHLKLPEFQRDFVWSLDKTIELFDSLVKEIFIGSIIYGVPSFEISVREIDDRPRKGEGSRRRLNINSLTKKEVDVAKQTNGIRLVLDGQQRITSIYRALKGIDEVWFICKNIEELDIENINNLELNEILDEFNQNENEEQLSIKMSDVYEIMNGNFRESEKRERFFNKLKISKNDNDNDEIFGVFLDVVAKIRDMFTRELLLSYYLLDMSAEKFALFFERSNSKGITLKFTDILAAKLYVGFNLRNEIERFEDANPEINLNREIIVRTISLLEDPKRKIDRKNILEHLNYHHFNEYWQEATDLYIKTWKFLFDNKYVISPNWIPYENMLIPLMLFVREIGGDYSQMTENQKKFIDFWFWSSIFSSRYTNSSNEKIIQDANILRIIAQGNKVNEKTYFTNRLRVLINDYSDLYDFSRKGSSVYTGFFNLVNFEARGYAGWNNSNLVTYTDSKLEDHHIYPVGYIKDFYGIDSGAQELVDCVANRTLIPKITNIKIGKKAPSKYLKELKENYNSNIERALNRHYIEMDLLDEQNDNKFLNFIEIRARRLFELMKNHTLDKQDWIIENFYEERVIEAGEKVEIFANYLDRRVEAVFEKGTNKVFYKDMEFGSPSGAAIFIKKEISGDDHAANGWRFWKYNDESGGEKAINDFR